MFIKPIIKRRSGKSLLFLPSARRVGFDAPKSVLQLALDNGLRLSHSCGGMGSCGTCLVRVESDLAALPPREELEAEMARERGFAPCERLACQLEAFDGLAVRTPSSHDDDPDEG